MTPVEPVLHEGAKLIVFAKDQPEYIPLPASVDADGCIMTEWEPTTEELDALLSGGRIRLWLFGAIRTLVCPVCKTEIPRLLSPIAMQVVAPDCGMRGE